MATKINRRHGGLYDRGIADAHYNRPFDPHYYPEGSYAGKRVTDLDEEDIAEYKRGFDSHDEDDA